MPKKLDPHIQDILTFLNASPTAWHAVDVVSQRLTHNGFEELKEGDVWKIKSGGQYFVTRNGSSICAFKVPLTQPNNIHVAASHTDSPALKLKPNAEYRVQNMVMIGVEVYGSPLLTSWLNRDLGIAGRIVYQDVSGKIKETLVRLDDHPVIIPQLAIHLDRLVNDQGVQINKQLHLAALAAVDPKEPQTGYLDEIIKEKVRGYQSLLGSDLFLYPLEPASLLGAYQQLIASYRIDSLLSVHAILTAFLQTKMNSSPSLKMMIFWDNEEVGSETAQGAGSPFFTQVLERLTLALGLSREDYLRLLSQSLCLSIDLAHALHPNHPEKHEPYHQPLLNRGIVIKTNAQQRYASNAQSSALIGDICKKNQIPFQHFVSRSDMPCGTTIGPIFANKTGIPTVDIGIPQLSMHSAREIASCQDHLDMQILLSGFYKL